jgi:hypothetical protein
MASVAVLVAVASSAVGAPASNGKRLIEWSVDGKRALPEWVTEDEIEQRMKVRVLVQHHLCHSLLLFLCSLLPLAPVRLSLISSCAVNDVKRMHDASPLGPKPSTHVSKCNRRTQSYPNHTCTTNSSTCS